MVTISNIIKKIISSKPMLQEALLEGVVSFANLAAKLQPGIERELGKKIRPSAAVMAIRRHTEQLKNRTIIKKPFKFSSELVMKTNLCDITIVKTPQALDKIKELYKLVNYEKGEILNIIQGNYEMAIIISQKHLTKVKQILRDEKILSIKKDLVSLTISLNKEFFSTPGVLSLVTRKFAWENINIFENISTMTELILIVAEKDAMRSYNAFQDVFKIKNS